MKKTIRLLFCLTLVLTMMLAMSVSAFAKEVYHDSTGSKEDTTKITFTKHYKLEGDMTAEKGKSPAEKFTVSFKKTLAQNTSGDIINEFEAQENVYGKIDDITIEADQSDARATGKNLTSVVTIPDFGTVGGFWYEVTEKAGNTAGVTYDANKYYMHVQVLNGTTDGQFIRLVTLHTKPGSEHYKDGLIKCPDGCVKNDGITNSYSSGELHITKDVRGNTGDTTKRFEVTVTFTAPADKTVMSDIAYTGGSSADNDSSEITNGEIIAGDSGWTGTRFVKIWLKHGDTVTFTNIPAGVKYEVQETSYQLDGYDPPTFSFVPGEHDTEDYKIADKTSGDDYTKYITGTIQRYDDSDSITIENAKNSTLDVGVALEDAPYIGIMILAVAAAAVFVVAKRKSAVR